MSKKHQAIVAAKAAVGQVAKVHKIKSQLIVLRTEKVGRDRDWRRMVKRLILGVLPNWKATDENQGVVVFSFLGGK